MINVSRLFLYNGFKGGRRDSGTRRRGWEAVRGLAAPFFRWKGRVFITELEVYAQRLVGLGYTQEDADSLALFYRKNGDLDGLECFIRAKEKLEVD